MTEKELREMISQIKPVDKEIMKKAEERQDMLIKPTGALGKLEDISVKIAGITGKVKSIPEKGAITVFAADNGVVQEGIASAPQSVTYSQVINMTKGLTGVGTLAEYFDVDLLITDVGVKEDFPDEMLTLDPVVHNCNGNTCMQTLTEKIVTRKIGYGTKNFAIERAMTQEEVRKAIYIGMEAAKAVSNTGHDIMGVGEMGIGNTSTSAAVLCGLTGLTSQETVGKGGGLDKEGLAKKRDIVDKAVERIEDEENSWNKVIEVLSQVGGFDVAAMTGAFLGAALYKIPVVIDGYISAVAALCAATISSNAKGYFLSSHHSKEPGYMYAMKALGMDPILDLQMRLGEGSGCPLAFQIIKGACATMCNMATFQSGEVDGEYLKKLDKEGDF